MISAGLSSSGRHEIHGARILDALLAPVILNKSDCILWDDPSDEKCSGAGMLQSRQLVGLTHFGNHCNWFKICFAGHKRVRLKSWRYHLLMGQQVQPVQKKCRDLILVRISKRREVERCMVSCAEQNSKS